MNKLIVVAHDFGMTHAVNEGILYALKQKDNIITELSLLVNAPGSEEAAELCKKLDVSVSLNLNLCSLKPISKGLKTMIDSSGNFLKPNLSTWDFSIFDKEDELEIEREINAQWDWFVRHVEKKPSAILSRKSEHGDPKVLFPIIRRAKKEGVALRSPVWKWKENYGAQSYVEQEGVRVSNNMFVGILDWKGRFGYDLENDLDKLIRDVNNQKGVSELLVFAGFVDKETFNASSVNWQRGQYIQLAKKGFVQRKLRSNFDLVSYKDLS